MPASFDEKYRLADVLLVGLAGRGSSTVATGARSIVHARVAAVGSTLPAASVDRTENVWLPAARPVYEAGEVHVSYAAPSSEQSYVTPGSDAKLIDALVERVCGSGPAVIVVSGVTRSTV